MTDTETLVERVRGQVEESHSYGRDDALAALAALAERLEAAEAEAELKRIETHHANAKRAAAEREVKRQEDEKWAAENRADEAERERDALSPGRWYLRERAETAEAQRDELLEALREISEQQPKTLEMIRSNGFVFDDIGAEPGNWKHLAFTIYTDVCEVDTLARAAIAKVQGGGE